MPRLGITRSKEQLIEISKMALGKKIEIIPLPFLKIVDVEFEWPEDIDSQSPIWIVFTSANGVHSFFRQINRMNINTNNFKYAVVGLKTKTALEKFGKSADYMPDDAYGKILFEEGIKNAFDSGSTVIYARAEQVNYDPNELFDENDLSYIPLICYKTVINELDRRLLNSFGTDDSILFTAPSTVTAFQEQASPPKAKAIALGQTTASAMASLKWDNITIMKSPDINKVMEYL